MAVWAICKAIENRDYVWAVGKVAVWLNLHFKHDPEAKTWVISSDPMFDPSSQRIDYSDIEAMFKTDPSSYHVHEEHDEKGHFRSFSVSTN